MAENVNGRSGLGKIAFLIVIAIALIALLAFIILRNRHPFGNVVSTSSGVLTCPISKFGVNPQTGCFLLKDGWDKYYRVTNIFVGPNVITSGLPSAILKAIVANPYKGTHLVASTCLTSNYEKLSTGILIQELFNVTNSECFSNIPLCGCGANLTIGNMAMSTSTVYDQAVYGVGVFIKSSTTNKSAPNVYVNWQYVDGAADLKN